MFSVSPSSTTCGPMGSRTGGVLTSSFVLIHVPDSPWARVIVPSVAHAPPIVVV